MAPRAKSVKTVKKRRVPKSVRAAAASVSKKAKAATSEARVTFGDGEKVPDLQPVPPPPPPISRYRPKMSDGVDLAQHVAKTIAQVASINSRGPEGDFAHSMPGPNSGAQAVDFLRDSEIAKEYPAPDPYKSRVNTMRGVYRLPPPTSLPPGARVSVPFTARAPVGGPRQFVVGVQGPSFAPVWRHE